MEDKIKSIMMEYLDCVNSVCNHLLTGLHLKNKRDFFEYRAMQGKMEFEVNGISYRLHGKGCYAFNEEMFIDWDFGYRSRWSGVDPWKLAMTLKQNKSSHLEYYRGDRVKAVCEQAVSEGVMFERYDQYYFTIPFSETFEPYFPKEFDTLVIEHFDSKWIVEKNKLVDRFLRKSRRVYKQIEKSENLYTLRFLLNGKEIYSIPYSDIGYPENAIKVMDEILRNNKKV